MTDQADVALPYAEVAEVFGTLDKAARSQRLYQANNPVYHGFIRTAQQAFSALWDRVPSLSANVEEQGFRWQGRDIAGIEGRESLPFLFYKDGIRVITFLPGFEEELEKFLDVVNRARSQDQQRGEDDMVTLLWHHQFDRFRYSYVDALAEGLQVPQSRVPQLAGLELTLVPEDQQVEGGPRPDQPPSPAPSAVESGEPTVAGLVSRDDFEETLYFLEPGELEQVRAELAAEMRRDLKADVLNALFDRLEDGLPEWKREALRILRQLLPVFLGSGDLRAATKVLVELNALLEAGKLDEEYRADAEALFRELSEPAVLSQLLHTLENGNIDPKGRDLGIFLQHLGPAAMPVLLASIERNVAGALQERLRTAMEGLADAHRGEVLALLRHGETEVVRGAARLAGQLGQAEAAPALTELMQRSDPTVRRVAVEALVRIRNSTALEAVQRALTDVDREVRIAAARGISSLRFAPARTRLEELLDSRTLREADLTEKIAFFEAYGSLANAESVAMLDRMLNGRRLLSKENPEVRACAAMALGRVGSPAARASLERAREDANPMVRNAVLKSLRQERT
ncbi:MAG TPA: HEAT repeat domain-containing protein [Longimicrobiales bacterium]|nr:HEAT repeat domain-containing protein [Longimicrobiales bacterium]